MSRGCYSDSPGWFDYLEESSVLLLMLIGVLGSSLSDYFRVLSRRLSSQVQPAPMLLPAFASPFLPGPPYRHRLFHSCFHLVHFETFGRRPEEEAIGTFHMGVHVLSHNLSGKVQSRLHPHEPQVEHRQFYRSPVSSFRWSIPTAARFFGLHG